MSACEAASRGTLREDEVQHLVDACMAARARGADFPTVWHEILKNNPLVASIPIQAIENGVPVLKVRLVTGKELVFGPAGYSVP
jgi:hypothetical protein